MAAPVAEGRLDALTVQLERAAGELRSHDLSPERASELVERCARLASEAANEIERQARVADGMAHDDDQLSLDGA